MLRRLCKYVCTHFGLYVWMCSYVCSVCYVGTHFYVIHVVHVRYVCIYVCEMCVYVCNVLCTHECILCMNVCLYRRVRVACVYVCSVSNVRALCMLCMFLYVKY